jgi:hypothetical protein
LRSRDRLAADVYTLFDELDTFSGVRDGLRKVAAMESSWAGIPMPLEGRRLVIEPTFPRAKELSDLLVDKKEPKATPYDDCIVRSRFWSVRKRGEVVIFQYPDGRIDWGVSRPTHPVTRLIDTLDCSYAWGLEQEHRAVQTLGTLLRHHVFKQYLLTGMFMEKSPRSGTFYLFRRLRPTLAITAKDDQLRIKAALCMHPIAHYEDTWAGAMTPTDDVIAHLMLMRADEPMFWRRSNQHPPLHPNAGVF